MKSMNTKAHLVRYILAALFLNGCAASHPISFVPKTAEQNVPFPDLGKPFADATKGRIYIIRHTNYGGNTSTEIRVENTVIGSTGPATFLCWEQAPGPVSIMAKAENNASSELFVAPAHAYYILENVYPGGTKPQVALEHLSAEAGTNLLRDCKPPSAHGG